MSSATFESTYPVSAERLFAWHSRPGAFGRLLPPWQRISLVDGYSELRDGARLSFNIRKGPLTFRWVATHRDVDPGRGFTDVQIEGPFRSWVHRHEFRPLGDGSSRLLDRIDYSLPGGPMGKLLAHSTIERDLSRTFRYRHGVLSNDLNLHEAHGDRRRLRVAVTGASGLVGRSLCDLLTTGGHQVVELVRSGDQGVRWHPDHGILEPAALGYIDAVIHLAGESIASHRWSESQKRLIRDSRVTGTRRLVESLSLLPKPPGTFISASAVGYYGDQGETPLTEDDPAGEGFLADVCSAWEQQALRARQLNCRVVLARFGVVLSPRGGALSKMLLPFRFGAGGRLGNGRQMMSWVSIDDAVGALHHLLMDPAAEGPFNVTAPRPTTNAGFTRSLGTVLRRPTVVPMPAALARLAFGEMADEMLLSSTRAHPMRLQSSGYEFRHPTLDEALRHVLGRP